MIAIYENYIKRIIDIIVSIILLIITFPVIITIALSLFAINRENPFYFQQRPGRYKNNFILIKFKTMKDRRDEDGSLLPDSERVTKLGSILRKTSLDELPELWNVFKGEMSLIGPRPLLKKYLPYFTEREQKRHLVRPGITGLSQVNGRHTLLWDERLELDVNYVESISFKKDLKIIYKTIKQVLLQKDVKTVSSDVIPDFDEYRKNKNSINYDK